MKNKPFVILSVIIIILFVGVVFSWIFGNFFGITQLENTDSGIRDVANVVGRPDPLITPASKVYQAIINENDPIRGDKDAKLTIIEFGDFECPYCANSYSNLIKILGKYKGQVKLVWKDFPIPVHAEAKSAALAARCAQEQGKFWEYHDYLFENQSDLSRDIYNKIALELNLDLSSFNECVDSQSKIELVGQGLTDGQLLGVDGTPYFFIGNRKFGYELDYSQLDIIINEELNKL